MMETNTESGNVMVDNYAFTISAIARCILDNAPAGLRERDRKELERIVEKPAEGRDYLNITFRTNDHDDCDLIVRLESDKGRFEAPDGSRWGKYKVSAHINWPSYGSMSVAASQARLALMLEVTKLASLIDTTFTQDVFQCWQTAEERKTYEENQRAQKQLLALQEAFESDDSKKNLRVGGGASGQYNWCGYASAPGGKTTVEGKFGKKFTVNVNHEQREVYIFRVK